MGKVVVDYELDNGWQVSGVVDEAEAWGIFRNPSDLGEVLAGFGPTDQVAVVLPAGVPVRGSVRAVE